MEYCIYPLKSRSPHKSLVERGFKPLVKLLRQRSNDRLHKVPYISFSVGVHQDNVSYQWSY